MKLYLNIKYKLNFRMYPYRSLVFWYSIYHSILLVELKKNVLLSDFTILLLKINGVSKCRKMIHQALNFLYTR